MRKVIAAGARRGAVAVPSSKSALHRLLICAALSDSPSVIRCRGVSGDVEATADCLRAMGAGVTVGGESITVVPGPTPRGNITMNCRESGSTLRFLLPVLGALGIGAEIKMEGRLPLRPIEPLAEELRRHGMTVAGKDGTMICSGRLRPGRYAVPGDVSSQFVTGLLLALPLMSGDSTVDVTGGLVSAGYVTLTEKTMKSAGVTAEKREHGWHIPGNQAYRLPREVEAEGDWSGAAAFLCMGAVSDGGVTVLGLDGDSVQGDRRIAALLRDAGAEVTVSPGTVTVRRGRLGAVRVDAADVPDLVPALCALAAAAEGETRIVNAGRLRYKESDRLKTTAAALSALGADIRAGDDGFVIRGTGRLRGGACESFGDHRIAMAAAAAASICEGSVAVDGAECVDKSYPGFWDDLDMLEVE